MIYACSSFAFSREATEPDPIAILLSFDLAFRPIAIPLSAFVNPPLPLSTPSTLAPVPKAIAPLSLALALYPTATELEPD